ncbi:DUF262 domain-containing protein [Ruminiclostridium herbifermentans]|uniref:DUF262 domain-containing protein n=1 Tax=Ruminiclostridium herbifermentans TaxID=2488810 RepID=UPI0010F8331D|nr:DUF262 domain-containing protein [Ruminiclostridium herbifermentans]
MLDNKIEAKEILVKDLFDSKFLFRVPEYQRQFSWENDNFDQLFEDIKESLESEEDNYFLGSVILQVNEINLDGSGIYDIVDGQQRLTTITILLAVMRDLTNSTQAKATLQEKIYQKENEYMGTKEEVRIHVRDREKDFFRKYVLEEEGTKKATIKNNLSEPQQRIVTAIEVFRNKFYIDGAVNQKLLSNMIKYILNNCVLVYVKTGNFTSAFRLFSVLNDRGMPLATSDLLKSANLSAVKENNRKRYQMSWEQIEEDLGRDELDKLIGFIRTILIKEKPRKNIVDEYNQMIFNGIMEPGEEYIQYLDEVANIYKERILNANIGISTNIEVKFYNLISIMRDFIPFSDWMVAFISFALKYPEESNLYNFLIILEKSYVINWIIGITTTKRIVETNRILQVIEKSKNAKEVFNDDVFDLNDYKNEVQRLLNDSLFYKMKFCKYILLRLDLYLCENSNINKCYKGTVSVEHVLPQNPKEDSEWTRTFDSNSRNELTHKLGNLVLLSRKKNSAANNIDFKEKIIKYYSNGITDFEITREIKDYSIWNHSSIQSRQVKQLNRILDIYYS